MFILARKKIFLLKFWHIIPLRTTIKTPCNARDGWAKLHVEVLNFNIISEIWCNRYHPNIFHKWCSPYSFHLLKTLKYNQTNINNIRTLHDSHTNSCTHPHTNLHTNDYVDQVNIQYILHIQGCVKCLS